MTRLRTKKKPRRRSPGRSSVLVEVNGCAKTLQQLIRQAARATLSAEGILGGQLEIAIVVDREMKRLHKAWMGKASTTDVLTFDLKCQNAQPRRINPKLKRHNVDGQIVVCETVARRRARAGRGDWQDELLLYVVHGCLHLCGYDDHRERDSARMHRREDEILTRLGHGAVYSEA